MLYHFQNYLLNLAADMKTVDIIRPGKLIDYQT